MWAPLDRLAAGAGPRRACATRLSIWRASASGRPPGCAAPVVWWVVGCRRQRKGREANSGTTVARWRPARSSKPAPPAGGAGAAGAGGTSSATPPPAAPPAAAAAASSTSSASWSIASSSSGRYGPSMAQIILPSENALETPAEGVGSASDRPRTPGSGERPGDDIPCPPVQENPRPSPRG